MSVDISKCRPVELLLVEDNENDVRLTEISFQRSKLAVNMHHVENGEKCLAFLRKEDDFADAVTPDLILLDLNMPVMDGREVLAEIVKDDKLKHLPVVVLTTSDDERDVLSMYKLRCSSYVTKPVDFNKFQEIIQNLNSYWFTIVMTPPTK